MKETTLTWINILIAGCVVIVVVMWWEGIFDIPSQRICQDKCLEMNGSLLTYALDQRDVICNVNGSYYGCLFDTKEFVKVNFSKGRMYVEEVR